MKFGPFASGCCPYMDLLHEYFEGIATAADKNWVGSINIDPVHAAYS
mgnify:CR=1 FL=1